MAEEAELVTFPDGSTGRYVWVPTSTLPFAGVWTLVPRGQSRPCRFTVGPGHRQCKAPSVATMLRGRVPWHYCGRHLYGRRIRDGVIESRILRVDETTGAGT